MEDFFAEILKYDMQRLDFKQFKDLYGDNFRDNSAICLLAMDCEFYINQVFPTCLAPFIISAFFSLSFFHASSLS